MRDTIQRGEPGDGAAPQEPTAPRPGDTITVEMRQTERPGDKIGPYKILQPIGEGGCGAVYMAEQAEPIRRRVALKVIKLGMDTKQVIVRFEAERQALALMDHPNIARVLDAGATETGRPYFVMELVRGLKITDYCDQNHFSTEQRLDLFVQVCHAIQHAHQKGIIHRDIKPSNILVTVVDGRPVPKVIDFGIAKAIGQQLTDKTLFTGFEQFIGTPAYMSPEQAGLSGVDVDTRSDIYALGVLLYELLTGQTPLDPKTLFAAGMDEMFRMIREAEPLRPSTRLSILDEAERTTVAKRRQAEPPKLIHQVRGDLDWIVMKCLEKDRGRRYETPTSLAADIEHHLKHEPVTAAAPSTVYLAQKFIRRHRVGLAVAGALVLLLAAGVVVSTWQAVRASRAEAKEKVHRQRAEAEAAKSQQVARLLKDMLGGLGPTVGWGHDRAALRMILDKTAERVSKGLEGQPDVEAELVSTIGEVYIAFGEYEKAELRLRDAVAMRKKLHGGQHSDVARSLGKLAFALLRLSKLEEAEASLREALAIQRKLLGNEHQDVASSLYELAYVLELRDRLKEAESTQREALAMRRKLLGKEHAEIGTSLSQLASVLLNQGRLDEAEVTVRDAIAMRTKLLGRVHPDTADSLALLARVLCERGGLDDAEALERESIAINSKWFGEDHPIVAWRLRDLADLLRRHRRLDEAETIYRQALAISQRWLGDEHPTVATTLESLAEVLRDQGKLAEAEPLARRCVSIREKKLPGNWRTFAARSLLGSILLAQNNYAEAEPLLVSGYEGMKQGQDKIPARSKPRLKEPLERLVRLYEATGRGEKAAECRQKLAELDQAAK